MAYRLLSRSSSFATYYTLHMENDHLLSTEGYYSNRYRRFFFKDIQAIFIRKTSTNTWQCAISFIALGFIAVAFLAGGEGIKIATGILGFPFLLFLIVNLIKGPTCECRIKTAVQFERIEPLNRVRKARKVIHRILPQIEFHQGPFHASDTLARALQINGLPEFPSHNLESTRT